MTFGMLGRGLTGVVLMLVCVVPTESPSLACDVFQNRKHQTEMTLGRKSYYKEVADAPVNSPRGS